MEKWKMRAGELLLGLAVTGRPDPSPIPYRASKTRIGKEEAPMLSRTDPARHGVRADRLVNLLWDLENDARVNLHNLVIVKGGEVIAECSAPGHDIHIAHLSHSMSKTVTGMAIGMLVDDGKLDIEAPVCDFFPEFTPKDRRFFDMSVEHLLAMRSGVTFAEGGSVTEERWTEAFFSSPLAFSPGEEFAYNSMNSYVLGRIVERISGKRLVDFLEERLFGPLGIKNYFWETGPEGVCKGGWGLYLSTESWARLGLLMLWGGKHEGRQLLSRAWVEAATSTHSITPLSTGAFNYGYQIWVGRDKDEFLFNGMLGQNVWVLPREDLVVAMTAGNNELFQESAALNLIRSYFKERRELVEASSVGYRELVRAEADFFRHRHWIRPQKKRRGLSVLLRLRPREPYIDGWDKVLGTYIFRKNNYGILPLIVRVMQSNYSGGIHSVRFYREGEHLFLTVKEGTGEQKIEIGLYEYRQSVLDLKGERYLVRALGAIGHDEKGRQVYRLELVFPELPNTRYLQLSFIEEGALLFRMSEMPSQRIAESFLSSMSVLSPKLELLGRLVDKRLGSDFLVRKMAEVFSPMLVGARVGDLAYTDILEREEKKAQKAREETAFLSELWSKHAPAEPKEKSAPRDSGVLDRLRGLWRRLQGAEKDGDLSDTDLPDADAPEEREESAGLFHRTLKPHESVDLSPKEGELPEELYDLEAILEELGREEE